MSVTGAITNVHIRKLDHPIDEIRVRALENVLSKLDLGYECDCNAVKKELLVKLFNWFSIEPYVEEGKVLDLMIKLIKSDNGSYLNSFGRMKFQNSLRDLRAKLNSVWHDKLDLMDEIASNPNKFIQNYGDESVKNHLERNYQNLHDFSETTSLTAESLLESTVPFDLTNYGDGAVVPRKSDTSIKWLVMPWQILVQSDKAVLSSLENSLHTSTNIKTKIQNCQFITNIVLQDFPAEVFLHRPTTVNILLALLESYKNEHDLDSQNFIITILKTLHKLSRALRFRIYYYCDPSIAHKAQKVFLKNLENEHEELYQRYSPDEEYQDDYHINQIPRANNKSPSLVIDTEEDGVLQLHQMFIPYYCTETLISALKLLSISNDASHPLNIVRYTADLAYELIQLFITSVMPTVWFCNDNIALKIHENVKTVLELLSEILDYYNQFDSIDYYRVTYIYFLYIAIKLMSNIVPLELADQIIPKKMKLSICNALMDAPIYLMYKSLHITLQEYARRFHGTQECDIVKLLDETRLITKSMKAAISLMKTFKEQSYSEELKAIYSSKLSLLYHKNFKLIRKFMNLAQNKIGYKLSSEDNEITTKMLLALLAHSDGDIQEATYTECHALVTAILKAEYNGRYNGKNLIFLMEPTVLIEIICYGTTHDNQKIKTMAEEMLLYLLKGKVEMTEPVWFKFLESLIPVLPLLQCLAHPSSLLGKAITNMLDPDVSSIIKLPFIEVLKGNIRLLFSPNADVREEALCRILWLLGREKDSALKLPRLSSLHGLSLSSLLIFEKQVSAKRSEGCYQRSALISVLEMLQTSNVEPKMRKSALVQISVMLSDPSLHKVFISENGLKIILDTFSKALIEKDFSNYPDSVVPIVTILKLLVSSECSVRIELSNRIDVYYNILRSLFLFPNNECIRNDAVQLLALLLYSGYIMRLTEKTLNNPLNISLPHLITINMRLPFTCKAHWKTSVHRRSDISILHRNNPTALTFIRQFWAWHWNDNEKVLWKKWQDINDPMISESLMIRETELACLTFSSLQFCLQQQLYHIQNSITHSGVSCAIDYLTMYLKLCYLLNCDNSEDILQLPWAHTFERFLQSHPSNREDHELFISVLNFLHLYLKITSSGGESAAWLCRAVKNMMKSLGEWLQGTEPGSEDVHQSVLRLTRACSMIPSDKNDESKCSWINFVDFAVTNLFNGEFYNLVFLEWVLSTMTYVISMCQWKNNKDLLVRVGASIVNVTLSFQREGSSFMGLTIIRDCIICLNHVFYQMQNNLSKTTWVKFWYEAEFSPPLGWLANLWRSRDPLVRASALQLLASLISGPHTALQLLSALDATPEALCDALFQLLLCREDACIVKEEACLALSNLIKNSTAVAFQYIDGLNPTSMLAYAKDHNVYHEIAVMCSNCYMLPTLDTDFSESLENDGTQTQSLASSRTATTIAMVPKTIYYLYNCAEDAPGFSAGNTDITDSDQMEFITTPSLITSLCSMLNNLITIGEHEVIREIFEHSVHKYLIGCFGDIPKSISGDRNLEHYSSVLEMYTGLCTVLTNCVMHSTDFASIVTFPSEFIRHLFDMLNKDLYFTDSETLLYLRNRLCSEIMKFLVSLSLTESQHAEPIQSALEPSTAELFLAGLWPTIRSSRAELGMSAISLLGFLLSLEMQCEEPRLATLRDVLDGQPTSAGSSNNGPNAPLGALISRELMAVYVVLNHTRPVKKTKLLNDRDVVAVALTNLLGTSIEAKRAAIDDHFPATCLMVLKEIYVKLNAIPVQTYKSQIDRQKMHPLLQEIDSLYVMLMNFMYDSTEAKEILAKAGLADVVHKLWAYTSLNKKLLTTSLKLLSTFTSNCSEASQSLPLTTVTPGVGLRKTPNSMSLVHVLVQLVIKEIETLGRNCDCQKLSFAFHILRNAVHNHDCRVVISKSNLLQFFTKIHPSTTKRTKLWQIVELNCLEFLIDFTFYDEGQLYVSKAVDSLEVLIGLARISSGSIKLLAISILRNLAFNSTNRPRLLGSAEYLDLLLSALKEGSSAEIELAGSSLWSLIGNNQKGKLIARSAGFARALQMAVGRLQLAYPDSGTDGQEIDLVQMLEYVQRIMSPQ